MTVSFKQLLAAIVITGATVSLINTARNHQQQQSSEVDKTLTSPTSSSLYHELYRPGYHFSPPQYWMNDPNGLLYANGKYHLYYQYNPYSIKDEHLSWGHAVSTDLVHWQNLPVAIWEYNNTMIFSGSAIVDKNNTSGLCTPSEYECILAFYCAQTTVEAQAIAYSVDNGASYKQYAGNPIIDIESNAFRDPKVIWYEAGKKWIMATVLADKYQIRFYESTNLLNWTRLSEFGPEGTTEACWEDPDLYLMTVENTGEKKWVLSHSVGQHVQYFVGDFNGTHFINSNPKDMVLAIDQGIDFYAGVTYNNVPDGRILMVAWASNLGYIVPTTPWKGQTTVVRELRLHKYAEGIRIAQNPVEEFENIRYFPTHYDDLHLLEGETIIKLQGGQLDIDVTFLLPTSNATSAFGIKVFAGKSQETVIGYDMTSGSLYIDRRESGLKNFSCCFARRRDAVMAPENGQIQFRILVDQNIIEVFGNNGKVAMSALVYPDPSQNQVLAYSVGGNVTIATLDTYYMSSIWAASDDVEEEGHLRKNPRVFLKLHHI
jgi:fructan beta-fructosidase